MSKLAKNIDAVLTGQVKAPRFRYTDVKFNVDPNSHTSDITKQIRLGVKLEHCAWIHDSLWNDTQTRSQAIRDIKRAMIDEMFGEFRPLIIELRSSIYDEDFIRTRNLLAELENQMFADGV